MQPTDYLSSLKEFNMLSLPDLLEARDQFHVHLMHKANVIATAIGRYRIRKTDPWPQKNQDLASTRGVDGTPPVKSARTIENSEVRPYSWPCVLVFVEKWIPQDEFGYGANRLDPVNMVPKAIYLADGRVVPICVVEAAPDLAAADPVSQVTFPQNLLGGGYPVLADVQGEERLASLGCLVTDGHTTYALTNRHVSGNPGEPMYSLLGGKKVRIGQSSDKHLTRHLFPEIYPSWPGKNVYVNLDVGLIEIDDKNCWTAQVYGIGQMGKLADLSIDNISLRLIECPVRAYGCASGPLQGQIDALFYRYKSVGGFEYVADFLIGPRGTAPFGTRPGDSGTIWLLEMDDSQPGAQPMPIAIQWGGHVFVDQASQTRQNYALATCLSTICNLLDVDIIRDWNTGQLDYWGAVGHYTIANKACGVVSNHNLKTLMQANLTRITLAADAITSKNTDGLSKQPFVPLADVPDLVWKMERHDRAQERPNHFADMDHPRPDGKTLLQLCKGHPNNIAVPFWQHYYTAVHDSSQGLLPFRVWQFYQTLVDFVRAGKVAEFVCAAGILSHYVGDACQPLHISFMFNGDPNDTVIGPDGTPTPRADGVHAMYEDTMVNRHIAEIMVGADQHMGDTAVPPLIHGGHQAAVAVVELMQKTITQIHPQDIIRVYNQAKSAGQKPAQVADTLWANFGAATISVILDGSRYLAMLWDSAWREGGGDQTIQDLGMLAQDTLINLYQDPTFLPSLTLDTIGPLLH